MAQYRYYIIGGNFYRLVKMAVIHYSYTKTNHKIKHILKTYSVSYFVMTGVPFTASIWAACFFLPEGLIHQSLLFVLPWQNEWRLTMPQVISFCRFKQKIKVKLIFLFLKKAIISWNYMFHTTDMAGVCIEHFHNLMQKHEMFT